MSKKSSTVGLRLSHKIQPRQFESLEVAVYVEEDVPYEEGKRDEAIDEFAKRVLGDFKRSFDLVCEDLGVEDKPVAVTHKVEDGSVKTAALPPADGKKSVAPSRTELDDMFS